MTTPRTPAELADTIEGANQILLRWNWEELRTMRHEEKDIIVAALRAYSASSAAGER